MRIHLLGTGSADGLPNPFCDCATCTDARNTGRTRGPSSALIDEVLLVDPGPGSGPAAGRQGTSLRHVAAVLITHGHPDHLAPEFLLWRSWISDLDTLHIYGPEHAIARCEHWVAPDAPVAFHIVCPGDTFTAHTAQGDYAVHVVPSSHGHGNGDIYAEEAVLFDISAPDGDTLLYATDTAALNPAALAVLRDRAFTAVLIEETFGHRHDSAGHLNLAELNKTLADLHSVGAVTPTTDVIAFHLSHHNPPADELHEALAHIGARMVDDGTIIDTRQPARVRELIIGGVRSGKSVHAEAVAARAGNVTYVATGGERPDDAEWRERVAAHRDRRPADWRTVETTDLVGTLANASAHDTLLIDCIGMWLTAQLDQAGAWTPEHQATALNVVHAAIDDLVHAVANCPARLIIVTNEVGQGVVPATASGRLFRDLLGITNTRLAQVCTETTFMVAGRALATRELP